MVDDLDTGISPSNKRNEVPVDAGTEQRRLLESLSISGFRGIDRLTIPRLGRVALIAGKNGVGKTTVLDGVQLYAAHGRFDAVRDLLMRREELTTFTEEDGDLVYAPAFDRLFHRNGKDRATIAIGPSGDGPMLQIDEKAGADERVLCAVFDGQERSYTPRQRPQASLFEDETNSAAIRCELLGPGLLRNRELARLWDGVALTDDETLALDAIRLVFGNRVDRAAVIGEVRGVGRRVMVRLSDHPKPLPLRSLGDGATRMFCIALGLANCRGGILLIDEAENGIHYSLQNQFWSMVLRAAEAHNTQVLATTHSKDCIDGFAEAALANPNVDANFVRIGRRNGRLRAVEYSKEQLGVAAEQNIEVR